MCLSIKINSLYFSTGLIIVVIVSVDSTTVTPILEALAQSRKVSIIFAVSVRQSACIRAAPTGRMSMKFDIEDLSGYNRTEISANSSKDQSMFYCCWRK